VRKGRGRADPRLGLGKCKGGNLYIVVTGREHNVGVF